MPTSPRLRQHPQDRLSASAQVVDLATAATQLAAEPHDAIAGHRQIAVFRHGPVTALLFVFEPEGLLKEHQTDGVVTIHSLAGRLVVTAEDNEMELAAGQLLALAPGVPHTVRALVASCMLLTVHKTGS
jgi:quercetin dioxygenase-like cupin family protein